MIESASVPAVSWAEQLPVDWEDLARSEGDPKMSVAWLEPWRSVFDSGAAAVCTVRASGRLLAGIPLITSGRTLTGWEGSPRDYSTRPIAPGQPQAATLLADAVAERGGFTGFRIGRSVPIEDPASSEFIGAIEASCVVVRDRFDEEPIVETTGEFSAYQQALSRSVRTRLGKYRRRLDRDYRTRFEVLAEPEDPRAEVRQALELEAAGWKGEAGSATLCFPRESEFVLAMGEAFHERGELVLSRAWADDDLIAVDLALLYGNRAWSLITSYNEAFGKYSPGLLLRIALIQQCFERGLDANELLGSQLAWKRWFTTTTRPVSGVEVYRRGRPGAMAGLAWRRWGVPTLKRPLQHPAMQGVSKAIKKKRSARTS